MGIFDRLRDMLTQPSIDDAHLYAEIANELDSGFLRDGIWAKALAESGFDESKARTLYMRMAVKALAKEQQAAMENAFFLYDSGRYADALDGLRLRVERFNDPVAMGCVAHIAWHGCVEGKTDREFALALLATAEQSQDANARRFIGSVFEPIDWKRSLASYDFAASKGNRDAVLRAKELRKHLKEQGLLPKSFMDRIFD